MERGYINSAWKCFESGPYVSLGMLPLFNIIRLRPIDKVLMEAMIRSVRFDGIQMKFCGKIDTFMGYGKWLHPLAL